MSELLELAGGEEPEREASAATDSAAVALALDRKRGRGGKADAAADRFLAAQEALIADQRRHLHEQMKTMRLRHFGERLKVTLQLLTILVGVVVVGTLAWMAFDAAQADGVVIKSFTVAPDLARRGVTGEVVASQLLDRLTDISDRAQSSAATGKFGAGWGQNISIQIPETGVSLGEIDRWLREKLGHEHALGGEVVQNADGTLTLNTRLDAHPLAPQSGALADLPALITRAAEAIYRREQPMAFMNYLGANGREDPEGVELGREMVESRSPLIRAYGYGELGNHAVALGDRAAALAYWQAADAEHAGLSWPVEHMAALANGEGRVEHALKIFDRVMAMTLPDPGYTPEGAQRALLNTKSNVAFLKGDHATVLGDEAALAKGENLGSPGSRASQQLSVAVARAYAHDGAHADADATAFRPRVPVDALIQAYDLADIAFAREDWAGFLQRRAAYEAMPHARPPSLIVQASKALALAKLGRFEDARALLQSTPLDCQPCVVVRAQLAETSGHRLEADHWFSEASRTAPSVPSGPLQWGRALLARGDSARATVQFREAMRRSPRAEEAVVGLGEARLAQGDPAGAVKQFEAAAKLTPRWARLHLKWGEALAREGRAADARAQLALAATLDLTPAERAELASQHP